MPFNGDDGDGDVDGDDEINLATPFTPGTSSSFNHHDNRPSRSTLLLPSHLEHHHLSTTTITAHHHLIATVRGDENCYVSSLTLAGKILFAGSSDGDIRSWERASLTSPDSQLGADDDEGSTAVVVAACRGAVKSLAVFSDKLFSAHQDHKIRVWRIRAQGPDTRPSRQRMYARLATMPTLGDRALELLMPKNPRVRIRRHKSCAWVQHADVVSGLALSADELLLYSVSWDRSMKVWQTSDFRCLESIEAHDDAINAVASACDGTVYTGSADKKIKVWRKLEGEKNHSLVATLDKHKSGVNTLALNSDGSVLYSGGGDRSIVVWQKQEAEDDGGGGGGGKDGGMTMAAACTLAGHSKSVLCLTVASDRVLISGSADKTIRIWSGVGKIYSCLSVLNGHQGPVKCLAATATDAASLRSSSSSSSSSSSFPSSSSSFLVYSGSLDCDLKVWRIVFPNFSRET